MGLKRFFRRARWDRERQDEIESHIQIETDDNIARGMPYTEAHAAARKKFGNSTLVREAIYRMNTIAFLDTLSRDLRYAVRALRHNPIFTVVAVLTLAIGIGANTAVFSVVNGVLLRPLAYPKAEELVELRHTAPGVVGMGNVYDDLPLSPSMYFTYAEQNRTFQSLGLWGATTSSVTGRGEPAQVRMVGVSDGVLQVLGVPPVAGRWLSADDQISRGPQPGTLAGLSTTAMLSYGYWQRHFWARPVRDRPHDYG